MRVNAGFTFSNHEIPASFSARRPSRSLKPGVSGTLPIRIASLTYRLRTGLGARRTFVSKGNSFFKDGPALTGRRTHAARSTAVRKEAKRVILFNTWVDTTKLDVTVLAAVAGYTALRLSMHFDRGFLPKPGVFQHSEVALTSFAYLGIVYLFASLITTVIVNPWWTVLFILFFTAILSEFVIISLLRQFTFVFSGATMLITIYLYFAYIF